MEGKYCILFYQNLQFTRTVLLLSIINNYIDIDPVCQSCSGIFSQNKSGSHDVAEKLLPMTIKTCNHNNPLIITFMYA